MEREGEEEQEKRRKGRDKGAKGKVSHTIIPIHCVRSKLEYVPLSHSRHCAVPTFSATNPALHAVCGGG